MGHDGAEGQRRGQGQKQRQLIHILNDNVGSLGFDSTTNRPPSQKREAVSPPNALDTDAIEVGAGWRSLPTGTDQSYSVPVAGQPAEDLEEVDLGPARVRVGQVLPVDDENVHGWMSMRPAITG